MTISSTPRADSRTAGQPVAGSAADGRGRLTLLTIGLCLVFLTLVLKTSWIAEDAFIGLRVVDNFVHGFGLRWNVSERVEAYTPPLWILFQIPFYFVTREAYFTTTALNVGLSLLTFLLVLRLAQTGWQRVFLCAALISSKAFIDFSTSGLENPLNHALIAGLYTAAMRLGPSRRRLLTLALLSSLSCLVRLENTMLCAPLLLLEFWTARQQSLPRALRDLALGFLPLLGWEVFRLWYYGFLLPNTAYAKLGTGLSTRDVLLQGLAYYCNSLRRDPVTLLIMTLGIIVGAFGDSRQRAWSLGTLALAAAIAAAGGDFMTGRFLTAPFVAGVLNLTRRMPIATWRTWALAAVAIVIVGLCGPRPAITSGGETESQWGIDDARGWYDALRELTGGPAHPQIQQDLAGSHRGQEHGVLDERLFFYPTAGLLPVLQNREIIFYWADQGRNARRDKVRFVVKGNIGFFGYYAGPGTFALDPGAVSDALLARLPAVENVDWRIGHFLRKIPKGYAETLQTGRNQIEDPDLAAYYDALHLVISGPLLSWQRAVTIARFNLGQFEHLIHGSQYRTPVMIHARLDEVSALGPGERIYFGPPGIEVSLPQPLSGTLDVALDVDNWYRLSFYRDGRLLKTMTADKPGSLRVGLLHKKIAITPKLAAATVLRIAPGFVEDSSIGPTRLSP